MLGEIQQMIPDLLKKAIQDQLKTVRASRAYNKSFNGQQKTVGGAYGPFNSAPYSNGTLYNSVNVYWETDIADGDPTLIVDFGTADWWYWIDFGRKPGVFPDLGAIKDWIKQKPIGRWQGISEDSQAYLIGRSIEKYGSGGTNFMEKAWESIRDNFESEDGPLAELAYQYIDNLIAEGRIIGVSNFNR